MSRNIREELRQLVQNAQEVSQQTALESALETVKKMASAGETCVWLGPYTQSCAAYLRRELISYGLDAELVSIDGDIQYRYKVRVSWK